MRTVNENVVPQAVPEAGNPACNLKCVLITPARNEAGMIGKTIESVAAQTVLPIRWIIVNDGSTDETEQVVKKYAAQYPWIELLNRPPRRERTFAGKAHAFAAGYATVENLDFDIVGNLDADVTFGPDYLSYLLHKFAANEQLGVAGTPFCEDEKQYDYRFTSIEHVSGACQLFRRRCFDEIGGYKPAFAGVDLIAVLTARMKGWQTRTFTDMVCLHHRQMGTAKQNALMVAFRGGHGDYRLGMHPLWETLRTPYQMTRTPIVFGGLLRLIGFYWAAITRAEKVISDELVAFRRREQMQRMRGFLTKHLRGLRASVTKAVQRGAWIYHTKNFVITDREQVSNTPRAGFSFVRITPANCGRVSDFREDRRDGEYRHKVERGEIGYFAECDGKMMGSIWATVNRREKPQVVRHYMTLLPNESLIHDIVTGEKFRGMGVGPFMVERMAAALLGEHGVSKIIVDVNVRNTPSLRMMQKAGLTPAEEVLYISGFGTVIFEKRLGTGVSA